MILEEILPDQSTLSAVLMACCDSQFLMQGKEIHAHALHEGLGSESLVGCSLVSMYCKCKDLAKCQKSLRWNSMQRSVFVVLLGLRLFCK